MASTDSIRVRKISSKENHNAPFFFIRNERTSCGRIFPQPLFYTLLASAYFYAYFLFFSILSYFFILFRFSTIFLIFPRIAGCWAEHFTRTTPLIVGGNIFLPIFVIDFFLLVLLNCGTLVRIGFGASRIKTVRKYYLINRKKNAQPAPSII